MQSTASIWSTTKLRNVLNHLTLLGKPLTHHNTPTCCTPCVRTSTCHYAQMTYAVVRKPEKGQRSYATTRSVPRENVGSRLWMERMRRKQMWVAWSRIVCRGKAQRWVAVASVLCCWYKLGWPTRLRVLLFYPPYTPPRVCRARIDPTPSRLAPTR